jgi:hypothetical protein
MSDSEEHAIATLMVALLDWVMEAAEHIQQHIPANEGSSLEVLAKIEMARAESDHLIDLSEELGGLHHSKKLTAKQIEKQKKLFKEFFRALETCVVAFDDLHMYFSKPVPRLKDATILCILRDHARVALGREIQLYD